MPHRRLLAATAVAALVPAAPAAAAPDRTFELGTQEGRALTASWSGVVTGVPKPAALAPVPVAGRVDDDATLLRVDEPGLLTITMGGGDTTAVDVDLEVFAADAAGEPQGERLAVSNELATNDEVVDATTTSTEPAYFLVRAYGYVAAQGSVGLTAELLPKRR